MKRGIKVGGLQKKTVIRYIDMCYYDLTVKAGFR